MILYGAAELAERWGISRQLLGLWRERGKAPAPDWVIKAGPVWSEETIAGWEASHTDG